MKLSKYQQYTNHQVHFFKNLIKELYELSSLDRKITEFLEEHFGESHAQIGNG